MRPTYWRPSIELSTTEQKVVHHIRRAKVFVFLRQYRHEIFDEMFQQELAHLYLESSRGPIRFSRLRRGRYRSQSRFRTTSMSSRSTNFWIIYGTLWSSRLSSRLVSVFNGLTDSVYAKTQHPQEAWQLEKWLGSAQSEHIIGSGGYVWPGIKSEDQNFLQAWQQKGIDVSAFLKEAQGTTTAFPITLGYNEASIKINDIFNQMYLGQTPVQQATSQAVQQANQAVQAASTGG